MKNIQVLDRNKKERAGWRVRDGRFTVDFGTLREAMQCAKSFSKDVGPGPVVVRALERGESHAA